MDDSRDAVVLLSGGQDSTTALHYALDRYARVDAVSFDYGQRHRIELELAAEIAVDAGIDHAVYDVPSLSQLGQASLTNDAIGNTARDERAETNVYAAERGLPPSFVPGRNLLFFTLGAAHAAKVGASVLVTGVCAQDRAGYPDCRREFVGLMETTIQVGFAWPSFEIDAPLLTRSKAETWALAADLGVLDAIVDGTNTCYEGDRDHRHDWGYGCGRCGACVERARGWDEYRSTLATA